MALLIRDARALTMAKGLIPRRGGALGELGVIDRADILIVGEHIEAVEKAGKLKAPQGATVVEANGRVVMPAFVDSHTHLCWAGDRLDEWDEKRAGASYLEILRSGGGIMSTVRAVRAASEEDLARDLKRRLGALLRGGTTTVEIKSGYGLTTEDELKMLRAIRAGGVGWPGTVVRTALLGHAIDTGQKDFVRRTVEETLPAVTEAFGALAVDAYCEEGAWSVEDCEALFEAALGAGHPVRVHADQFNALGMVDWAVKKGPSAVSSVDHLEATGAPALKRLAASGVFATALPCAGFHTDGRYMDARTFVDANGALAIATNCNPGSAPCQSMPMAIALAVRHRGLSPAQAIAAATVNGAALLRLDDRGVLAPGKRADVILLRHRDERQLAYEFGGDPVDMVVCMGEVIKVDAAS